MLNPDMHEANIAQSKPPHGFKKNHTIIGKLKAKKEYGSPLEFLINSQLFS